MSESMTGKGGIIVTGEDQIGYGAEQAITPEHFEAFRQESLGYGCARAVVADDSVMFVAGNLSEGALMITNWRKVPVEYGMDSITFTSWEGKRFAQGVLGASDLLIAAHRVLAANGEQPDERFVELFKGPDDDLTEFGTLSDQVHSKIAGDQSLWLIWHGGENTQISTEIDPVTMETFVVLRGPNTTQPESDDIVQTDERIILGSAECWAIVETIADLSQRRYLREPSIQLGQLARALKDADLGRPEPVY